jgi:hypothetical protein
MPGRTILISPISGCAEAQDDEVLPRVPRLRWPTSPSADRVTQRTLGDGLCLRGAAGPSGSDPEAVENRCDKHGGGEAGDRVHPPQINDEREGDGG